MCITSVEISDFSKIPVVTGKVHRPRKKREAKSSKTAQLEVRLNNLTDALQSPGQGGNPPVLDRSPKSNQGNLAYIYASSSVSTEVQAQEPPSEEQTTWNIPVSSFRSNARTFTACTCRGPVSKDDLVPLELDETLLSIFMNQLSTKFPFVIIPAGTTARQLQETRPFLLKVIRMVASVRHLRSMRGQSRAVIQHISDAMLMRSERSLDLLQSILVILGFYHYHCMTHAQFNNLTHLAVSLIEDMDLSTPPKSQERRNQLPLIRAENPRSRTNEERRALVGVWYMSSNSAALVVKQFEPVRYAKYLNQCLQELEDAAEYETDQLAVQLVRIQHLTEKIFYFHSRDQIVDELPGIPTVPTTARLEAFQIELDRLWNALPRSLKSDFILSCHYNSAYLWLFEPFLAGAHLPDDESQSLGSLSLEGLSIFDVFSSFTAALKAWFDHWLSIPVCSYFYLPQPTSAQLIHASITLTRWVRVAGASVLRLSSSGTTAPRKEGSIFCHPMPAFSGIPECPDLGLPQPSISAFTPPLSAQTLNRLRDQVLAQPGLHVDVFGILDAMTVRFKSAKKEMTAAQGGAWNNDTWDLAAEHLEIKKSRVEKWCETVAIVVGEERNRPTDASNFVDQESGKAVNMLGGRGIGSLEWFLLKSGQENRQWESDLFDEFMKDINTTDPLDSSDSWGTGVLDEIGLMNVPSMEGYAQN
ncbi:hypothetical protein B7463_g6102, partial [Scytalidium lignicola]